MKKEYRMLQAGDLVSVIDPKSRHYQRVGLVIRDGLLPTVLIGANSIIMLSNSVERITS